MLDLSVWKQSRSTAGGNIFFGSSYLIPLACFISSCIEVERFENAEVKPIFNRSLNVKEYNYSHFWRSGDGRCSYKSLVLDKSQNFQHKQKDLDLEYNHYTALVSENQEPWYAPWKNGPLVNEDQTWGTPGNYMHCLKQLPETEQKIIEFLKGQTSIWFSYLGSSLIIVSKELHTVHSINYYFD